MPHDPFDERLSAYLDGELAPAERDEIESLLRQRPDLAEALDQVRQLGDGIRQLPREALGPGFADRVLAAARQAGSKERLGAAPYRRRWLIAAVGAIAATAAVVLVMVAMRPRPDDIVKPKPRALSPAEQAVAAMLAQAENGKAVVVRLRLTKDAIRGKALDQALAAAGISAAPATASNPAAKETAQAYKSLAAESQEPGGAADVLFIEAEQARLQRALAAVAQSTDGVLAIASVGVVPSNEAGIDRLPKQEGERGTPPQELSVDRKNYAQHLPPRGFPLLKSCAQPPSGKNLTPSAANAGKPARVLVVVEVIP